MTVLASKVRKGQKIWLLGVIVEVTKREKWNSRQVKVHFKDCGHGLPASKGLNKVFAKFEDAEFLRLDDELELA